MAVRRWEGVAGTRVGRGYRFIGFDDYYYYYYYYHVTPLAGVETNAKKCVTSSLALGRGFIAIR